MSEGPISLQKDNKYTKIFVGGLPYHTTDDTLRDFFLKFGEIEEAVVIYDRATRKSKGYGFVTMKEKEGAERAVADPNPFIDGRKSNVNLAYLGAKPKGHSQPGSPMSGFSTGRSNSPNTHFHPQNSPPLPLPGPGFFLHSPAPPPHFFHHEGTPPFSPPPLINPMLLPAPFFNGAPHPPPFGFIPGHHHPYIEPHNQHQLVPQMVPFNVAN